MDAELTDAAPTNAASNRGRTDGPLLDTRS